MTNQRPLLPAQFCSVPSPSRSRRSTRVNRRNGGFTLLELLVVIGIILVLITILIPVISAVRQSAYATNTAAEISQIRSAIENYHLDYRAYPGPFDNASIITGVTATGVTGGGTNSSNYITMSENLVLGVVGGLTQTGIAGSPAYTYVPANVGRGPMVLSIANPSIANSYLSQASNFLSAGNFVDSAGVAANDTNIPEFLDRFPDPLPIIYIRARAGAVGVVSDNATGADYQYDVRQLLPYTHPNLGGHTHGLQNIGSPTVDINKITDNPPFDALPYLRDLTRDGSGGLIGTTNDAAVSRQHDGYILISAGKDRIYGTFDDLCSFGNVHG